jgi:flagellar protein FlbD
MDAVIIVTRLGGGLPIALNPDLIERAEPTPDTVLTLIDGHKLVISESVPELVELIRQWRASIAAAAYALSHARLTQPGQPGQPGRSAQPDAERELQDETVELSTDDVAAHSTLGGSLARVFRLPPREG